MPDAEVERIRARLLRPDHDGKQLYATREGRIAATLNDPAAFAWLYLRKHITSKQTGEVSFSSVHLAWCESAKTWRGGTNLETMDRRAEVAPREMGKSTWWFLLLPMWAAAMGHISFIAAFANTPAQAETHLATFKAELENNALLRNDFPDLVNPKTRGRGTVEADRVSLYHARSSFTFSASGMDSSNLGLKVGDRRPDLIIMDDIEPHEGNYSVAVAKKRLDTLQSAILPLNIYAHLVLVGTVTMTDSIVHQIVKRARGERNAANDWVDEEHITARHFPPIITNDAGDRESIWPVKWSLEYLESIEHTRSYRKNYANDPLAADGDYWTLDDFVRDDLDGVTRILVSVDPAVTTKKSSDYTGIAVIGWSPSANKCVVLDVRQVKLSGKELRLDVLRTLDRYGARLVLVETNQGGDLWGSIFWGMPVKVRTIHQHEPKEVRAAAVLDNYQRGRVVHATEARLAEYEGQLVAFPNAPHDDMVDAAGSGIQYFLKRSQATKKRVEPGGFSLAYG
jgi:predicted phage terminase large subunit-like protein